VGLLSVFGQGPERQRQRPGGRLGPPGWAQNPEAAVEYHQGQSLGSLLGVQPIHSSRSASFQVARTQSSRATAWPLNATT
jgi:hypothetical protein